MTPRRARDKMVHLTGRTRFGERRVLIIEDEIVPGEGTGDPPRRRRTSRIELDGIGVVR